MSIFSPVSPRRALLPALLLVSVALFLLAQADVSGFWVYRVPTGDGNFRETFFELKQSGETVAGTLYQGARQIPIAEGSFKGGKLHFVVSMGSQNQTPPRPPMVYE